MLAKIDKLDSEIIRLLQEDGRMSFSEIASTLGKTKETVAKRFNKMTKAGIISGSTLLVDVAKLGYPYRAHIGVRAIHTDLKNVIDHIKRVEKTNSIKFDVYFTLGKHNLYLYMVLTDPSDLLKAKQAIRAHPSVIELEADLETETSYFPENLSLEHIMRKIE
jgi:Lrp/AsnC family transcriptional regulator, regulator for asnA, asnC and gidA